MMSGNDLQVGLLVCLIAAVAVVLVYNFWQERRARKHAEQAFRSTHHDVLLDEKGEASVPPPPGGRMEPGLRREPQVSPAVPASRPQATTRTMTSGAALPEGLEIDCVVSIDAPAGVSASALFAAQIEVMSGFAHAMRWFGWDDIANQWFEIGAHTAGSITRACVSLQLADRRGGISSGELDRFYKQLQQVCDQFLAVPRLPQRTEVLDRAAQLDAFCVEVDIQIAINLLAGAAPFPGTKLRGLAEAGGMTLGTDGVYHLRDDAGNVLFSLRNAEPVPFSPEQLRMLQSPGLILSLDVPRALNPAQSFDRLIMFAQKLATALDGQIVDDNRVPLSERSIGLIRNQVYQFESQMERQGIPAGSPLALRLFA